MGMVRTDEQFFWVPGVAIENELIGINAGLVAPRSRRSESSLVNCSCGGSRSSYGADKPKQYLTLADEQPVLAHTLARLHRAFPSARLVLCLDADDRWFYLTGCLLMTGSGWWAAASEWTAY